MALPFRAGRKFGIFQQAFFLSTTKEVHQTPAVIKV